MKKKEKKYRFIESYVNKNVNFPFNKQELNFFLSQSLFSSYKIDDGSRLLLKSIIEKIDISKMKSILDVGCGIGVLGICLKKNNPEISLHCQDRDALAVEFTKVNCKHNNIQAAGIKGALALQDLGQESFDLIISNLPAKAGPSVLEDIIIRNSLFLADRGIIAIVIIKPLVNLIESAIVDNNGTIVHKNGTKEYTVFHYMMAKEIETDESYLAPYIRDYCKFNMHEISYELEPVYNMPDFDTIGHQIFLAGEMLKREKIKGKVLFWNPGQGHLPVYLSKKIRNNELEFHLGSRDILSLEISKRNLLMCGVKKNKISCYHLPTFMHTKGKFDFIILFPDKDPGVPLNEIVTQHASFLLKQDGKVLTVSDSTFIFRLIKGNRCLHVSKNKKFKGSRAIILH